MVVSIPSRLQESSFRFVLIKPKEKGPFEKNWQKTANYVHGDPKLSKHLEKGGNYGVLCGNGLVVIDADSGEVRAAVEDFLPPTFTVQTGRGGRHFYYHCDDLQGPLRLARPGDVKGTIGDVQSTGKQVVGPGSIHPSGNAYTVANDRPIASVKAEQIQAALSDFLPPPEADTLEEIRRELPNRSRNADLDSLKVQDVIPMDGLKGQNGKFRGPCPWHGSATGHNFEVDISKNMWHCFRHGTGGGPLYAIAVQEKILDCGDCIKGALKGEKFKRVLETARDKYGLKDAPRTDGKEGKTRGTKSGKRTEVIPRGFDGLIKSAEPFIDEEGKVGFAVLKGGEPGKRLLCGVKTLEEWEESDEKLVGLLKAIAHEKGFGKRWKLPGFPRGYDDDHFDDRLLTNIIRDCTPFVDFPSDPELTVFGIMAIYSYIQEMGDVWPRYLLYGRTKTGKSRVLLLALHLFYRAHVSTYPTAETLYRLIEKYRLTIIIDEIQKLKKIKEKWDPIMNVYLSGYDGTPVDRCNDSGDVDSFDTAGMMVVSSKDKGLDEDAENRSIISNMKPRKRKLEGKPSDKRYPLATERRGDLLAFRLQVLTGKVDYQSYVQKADEMLDGDGVEIDGKKVELDDRAVDMGRVLLPVALMFNAQDDLFKVLSESELKAKDELRSSFPAEVFYAIQFKMSLHWDLDECGQPVKLKAGHEKKFTTKEILEQVIHDRGRMDDNYDPKKNGPRPHAVTDAIKNGLGFKIKTGGTGNASYLLKEGFIDTYLGHLRDYGHYGEDSVGTCERPKDEGGDRAESRKAGGLEGYDSD